jgi:hypothetical protein
LHELQLRIAIKFFWNCIYLNELQIATDFLQTRLSHKIKSFALKTVFWGLARLAVVTSPPYTET